MKRLSSGKLLISAVIVLSMSFSLAGPKTASAVLWKGLDFNVDFGNQATIVSNVINGSDQLEITMKNNTDDFAVAGPAANAAGNPTILGDGVGINATGTPYVQVSFIDSKNSDGTWPGYEVFFQDGGGDNFNSRGSVGAAFAQDAVGAGWTASDATTSLTTFGLPTGNNPIADGHALNGFYGEVKFSDGGTARSPSYATSPGGTELALAVNAAAADAGIINKIQRTDGSLVQATVGQLSDGTIEWTVANYAGVFAQWQSPYLKNKNGGTIDWNQIDIRFVGGGIDPFDSEHMALFTDFQYGGDYEDFRLTLGPIEAPVPEPGSLALLSLGLIGFAARRRRRR